jgi:hypothetical protein
MSDQREVWLPVPGFEGFYEVSNLGQVRNAETGLLLKPGLNRGYKHVCLCRDGKGSTKYIQRLVLLAFCGEPHCPDADACHNDGDKTNNCLTNLRWGTRADNCADKARHGTQQFGTKARTAKLNEDQVLGMRRAVRAGKSTYSLAKEMKLSAHTVWCAVVGKTWKHVPEAVNNV